MRIAIFFAVFLGVAVGLLTRRWIWPVLAGLAVAAWVHLGVSGKLGPGYDFGIGFAETKTVVALIILTGLTFFAVAIPGLIAQFARRLV